MLFIIIVVFNYIDPFANWIWVPIFSKEIFALSNGFSAFQSGENWNMKKTGVEKLK